VTAARDAGLLSAGGGHAMAAGFTAQARGLAALHAHLCEHLAAAAMLPDAADLPVEASLAASGCTAELAGQVARLGPFGNGNEEPMLVVPRLRVGRADRVGPEGGTIRAFLQDESGEARLKALLFRARGGPLDEALLAGGALLHVAGHLRADSWQGRVTPSLMVSDAAPA
jgi:single-stranded-DNA-specific exonuclease